MTGLQLCIGSVTSNGLCSKYTQLRKRHVPVQALLCLASSPDIGQLYSNIRKLPVQTDDVGIHERLRPVHLLTRKIRFQKLARRLDFFYRDNAVLPGQQTVTASVNDKQESLMPELCLKIDLLAVTFLVLLLYMLMNTCPLGHGRTAAESRLQAAAAEYIFNQ